VSVSVDEVPGSEEEIKGWCMNVIRRSLALWFLVLASAAAQVAAADAPLPNFGSLPVYIGTYTHGKGPAASQGIYHGWLDLDTGKVTVEGVTPSVEPSFLAVDSSSHLFAANEGDVFVGKKPGAVTAFSINGKTDELRRINQRTSEGSGPCHVSLDAKGRFLLVANYGSGSVAVLPIEKDGRLEQPSAVVEHKGSSVNPQRQEGPHAHSIGVDPQNRFVIEADLGLDKLFVYRFNSDLGTLTELTPAKLDPGSGPRHFVFGRDGRFVYVINELASTITTFSFNRETGELKSLATVSTLPKGFSGENTTAEIDIHPNGRFLYGSNRGHDSIVVFAIDPETGRLNYVGHQPSGGKTPRSFGIDPTGRYLLAANQDSNNVVVMRINQETGKLTPTGNSVEVGMPVCVKMIPTAASGR
jgi:6-phosphogluconolactonase